ncbi:MAG: hypothetical protein ACM3H8_05610, partial [Sphingobacteriales bacterium]
MKKIAQYLLFVICCLSSVIILFSSCNSESTVKPRGYFNIDLPAQKEYVSFNRPDFPFSFDYPSYGNIVQDSTFFDDKPQNPY